MQRPCMRKSGALKRGPLERLEDVLRDAVRHQADLLAKQRRLPMRHVTVWKAKAHDAKMVAVLHNEGFEITSIGGKRVYERTQ